ncbi:uncharacterized protein [Diadema setosum]|uniref:uncharacterized protein n=1 Tax=Diadema setosum TaxID=31175 RepID=UPI003B3B1997
MAASSGSHRRKQICANRPLYRDGRKERAVKVFTINQESRYLLVQGVPDIRISDELLKLFSLYGLIEEYRILDDLPAEEFTKNYWIKYGDIQAARIAKRKLDDHSFYGGFLHVTYAPEFETVQDTRQKLQQRRMAVARRLRKLAQERAAELEEEDDGIEAISAASVTTSAPPTIHQEPVTAWGRDAASGSAAASTSTPTTEEGQCDRKVSMSGAKDVPGDSPSRPFPFLPAPPCHLPPWQWNIPSGPEFPGMRTSHETLPAGFNPFPDRGDQSHNTSGNTPNTAPLPDGPLIGPQLPPSWSPTAGTDTAAPPTHPTSSDERDRTRYHQLGARPKQHPNVQSTRELATRTSRLSIEPASTPAQNQVVDHSALDRRGCDDPCTAVGQERQQLKSPDPSRPRLVARRRLGPNPGSGERQAASGDGGRVPRNTGARPHQFLPRVVSTQVKRSASSLDEDGGMETNAPVSVPVSGDASYDRTVMAVREQISQVSQPGSSTTSSPLDSIILQARNRERMGTLPHRPPTKRHRI